MRARGTAKARGMVKARGTAKARELARGTEREGRPEQGRWPERDGQSESRREGEGEGMTTTSCSQAKREGGEQHGQCKLKDSERRSKNLQIPKEGPRVGLGPWCSCHRRKEQT